MQYKRKMGIDYGDVRVGIAFSDLLGTIASPHSVYKRKSLNADLEYLSKLIAEQEVDIVVFGLPLNMDGTEGLRAEKTRDFAGLLEAKAKIEIVFVDERLTSFEAEELLKEAYVKREKRKELIDMLSAQIILKSYLDGKK